MALFSILANVKVSLNDFLFIYFSLDEEVITTSYYPKNPSNKVKSMHCRMHLYHPLLTVIDHQILYN